MSRQKESAYFSRAKSILKLIKASPVYQTQIKQGFNAWRGERVEDGSRACYPVGTFELPSGEKLNAILKFYRPCIGIRGGSISIGEDGEILRYNEPIFCLSNEVEFGTFELYYDYLAEKIQKAGGVNLSEFIKAVEVGDLGAVPFFHLAVTYDGFMALLTEGLPPCIAPRTDYSGNLNGHRYMLPLDHCMEDGRIIDLELGQSALIMTHYREGSEQLSLADKPDRFGIVRRGRKYLLPENRLDLN